MPFTVIELEILAGLRDGKTLTEIAAAVYLGQPAITRALQALRRKAGVPLVEHRGRRVYLTPVGLDIAQSAQEVLLRHHHLDRQLDDLRAGSGGPLNLIATTTPSGFILPPVVGEFLRRYPSIRVNLRTAPPEEIWDIFEAERYDLGVGPPLLANGPWTAEQLYEDEVTFFVAPDSPLAHGAAVDWEDLERETLIGPFSAPYWDKVVEARLRGIRRIDVRPADAVKLLVESGGGVGMLLGAAVRRELAEGRLARLHIQGFAGTQPFWLVRRSTAFALPVVEQFDVLLRARVRDLYAQRA